MLHPDPSKLETQAAPPGSLLVKNPLTLQEIATRHAISRERVRQIETRVKQKLKDYLRWKFIDFAVLDVSFVDEQKPEWPYG